MRTPMLSLQVALCFLALIFLFGQMEISASTGLDKKVYIIKCDGSMKGKSAFWLRGIGFLHNKKSSSFSASNQSELRYNENVVFTSDNDFKSLDQVEKKVCHASRNVSVVSYIICVVPFHHSIPICSVGSCLLASTLRAEIALYTTLEIMLGLVKSGKEDLNDDKAVATIQEKFQENIVSLFKAEATKILDDKKINVTSIFETYIDTKITFSESQIERAINASVERRSLDPKNNITSKITDAVVAKVISEWPNTQTIIENEINNKLSEGPNNIPSKITSIVKKKVDDDKTNISAEFMSQIQVKANVMLGAVEGNKETLLMQFNTTVQELVETKGEQVLSEIASTLCPNSAAATAVPPESADATASARHILICAQKILNEKTKAIEQTQQANLAKLIKNLVQLELQLFEQKMNEPAKNYTNSLTLIASRKIEGSENSSMNSFVMSAFVLSILAVPASIGIALLILRRRKGQL